MYAALLRSSDMCIPCSIIQFILQATRRAVLVVEGKIKYYRSQLSGNQKEGYPTKCRLISKLRYRYLETFMVYTSRALLLPQ